MDPRHQRTAKETEEYAELLRLKVREYKTRRANFHARLATSQGHSPDAVVAKGASAPTPLGAPSPRVYLSDAEETVEARRENALLVARIQALPTLVGYKVVNAASREKVFAYKDWIKYVGILAIRYSPYLMSLAYQWYCNLCGTTAAVADAGWWQQFTLGPNKVNDEAWWQQLVLGAKGPDNMFGASQSGSVVNAVFANSERTKTRVVRKGVAHRGVL